jgi:hypothetical protein
MEYMKLRKGELLKSMINEERETMFTESTGSGVSNDDIKNI